MQFNSWLKRLLDNKWERQAFNCSKCPKAGCPAWYEGYSIVNPATGAAESYNGCQFVLNAAITSEALHYTHATTKAVGAQNHLIGAAIRTLKAPATMPLLEGEIVDDVPE
jgi:hypothetical protein